MLNTVAIVQARMGAERLPNKMMLDLHGYPVIEWVLRRLSPTRRIDSIVFAIPDTGDNDELAKYLERTGANVFRGSETDVLGRYIQAARHNRADRIVRICADNPFVSAAEIDRLIDFFDSVPCDYAYNHVPRGNRYPDGLGAEITTMQILACLDANARSPEHREHIFNYIWDNREQFSITTLDPDDPGLAHPELKLDIDTADDYKRMKRLNVRPEMTALEIVNEALITWGQEDKFEDQRII